MKPNINELLDKVFSLSKHGIKLGLENMHNAIKKMELDLSGLRIIHIAGTNGKGSTASMLYTLIREHNKNEVTALYTSPHLIKFNERIIVNDKQISDDEIVNISELIFTKCKEIPLTFFEFTTLLAFQYFINKGVRLLVLETGLGGRLDATNVVNPELAIITSIGLDHTEYLGDNLEKIAKEKAGIFKKDQTAIISKTSCNTKLKELAQKAGVRKVYEIGENIKLSLNSDNSFNIDIDGLSYFRELRTSLLGKHQASNATLAVTAFLQLGFMYSETSIKNALIKTNWNGRLEKINIHNKELYIDVSHNVEGIKKTEEFFMENYNKQPLYTACGFMKDKNYIEMIDILVNISKKVFLVPTNIRGRELGIADYKKIDFGRQNKNILICKDFKDAVQNLLKEDGVLLFTGSIYNYEHIQKQLQEFK